jgi:type VI secretion system secreted protein Hcp
MLPSESVSLNFAKIEFDYKEQKPDGTLGGSVKAGWDVKANKKV